MQNAFAALAEELDDKDDEVQTVITQMAALTTQSQLTASTAAETNASVTAVINQLAANQQAINSSLRHLQLIAIQHISRQRHPHHPCSNSTSHILARSSLQDLELVEGKEAVDAASVQTRDTKGIHHLQISWDAVAKVAYPPLEAAVAAVLRWLHNEMHHVMWRQCIPTSSNGTRTGTFVSLAVLM